MEGTDGASLTFVVPMFNERDGVAVLWRSLVAAGEHLVAAGVLARWDAVLVDDGSSDGTAESVVDLASEDDRLFLLRHDANLGLGAALSSGLRAARGDLVLYTDADLPFDLRSTATLLAPILRGEVDLVSACRRGRFREGVWRGVQSHAFNLLVRAWWRLPLRDVNFACKVASRRGVPDVLTCTTGAVDLEWLLWARGRGLVISQPTVDFEPRRWGRSTLGGLRTVPSMVEELRRLPRRPNAQ